MHENALLCEQPFHHDPLKGVGLGKFQVSSFNKDYESHYKMWSTNYDANLLCVEGIDHKVIDLDEFKKTMNAKTSRSLSRFKFFKVYQNFVKM
jgi:hypothetical protein